jgi:hypothetical protein
MRRPTRVRPYRRRTENGVSQVREHEREVQVGPKNLNHVPKTMKRPVREECKKETETEEKDILEINIE